MNELLNHDDLRIRWWIRLRWMAIAGQAAMITTCLGMLRIRIPLLMLALVLLVAVLSQWVLWHITRRLTQPGNSLVGGVLALDVVLLTAVLFLTGGPHNPFTMLYLTQIVMAAWLIGARWTWSLLGLVLICFAGLFWRHIPLALPSMSEAICGVAPIKLHLMGMFLALAFTGAYLAWFVARLNAQLWERRQLERKVDRVTHREQHDVGARLHEDLCQQLVGLAALGKTLEHRLHACATNEVEIAREITCQLEQTLALAKQMADRLLPIAALENGLLVAVNGLAAMTQAKFGIHCQVFDSGFPAVIDQNTAIHLYRMIQEAVTNVICHAGATLIQIKLSSRENAIQIEIADNGIGISETSDDRDRMGIQMMRYRSDLIEANLRIGRVSPQGTTVAVHLNQR